MTSPTKEPTHVAVLLLPPVQLLDAAPVDLFSMLTADYLRACRLPQPLLEGAVPVRISYVAAAGPAAVADTTAAAGLRVTHALSAEEVGPGAVDVLLIPGPDPAAVPSEAAKEFVRAHAAAGAVVMSVCTGAFVAGHAGVLDGRQATGPRALLGELRKKFPKATWHDKRWVQDGKVWTSGTSLGAPCEPSAPDPPKLTLRVAGVTNGNDMVAAYVRETWPGPTAEAVLAMADVGDRGQEYRTGQARDNAWWVWQILRAWVRK